MKYVNVQLSIDADITNITDEDAKVIANGLAAAISVISVGGIGYATVESACVSDAPIVLSSELPRG